MCDGYLPNAHTPSINVIAFAIPRTPPLEGLQQDTTNVFAESDQIGYPSRQGSLTIHTMLLVGLRKGESKRLNISNAN